MFDRDYAATERRMTSAMPPVTKWLLIVNIAILVIELFMRPTNGMPGPYGWGPINKWGAFTIESAILGGRIWEFLTFQFLHADLLHVVFNSIGLFVFGPHVERYWGTRRFIAYYLLCGAGGAVFYSLLFVMGILPHATVGTPLVGASAGVFGLIFAVYRLAPSIRVRLLFPPITLTMRQLAIGLGCFAVLMILIGMVSANPRTNSGGEAGHLGGALVGLLLMRRPQWLDWARPKQEKIVRPREFRRKTRIRQEPKVRPRTELELAEDDEVDRILDKVSEQGFDSLTDEERRTLKQAGERKS